MSNSRTGCVMILAIPLVMLTGVFMFVFAYLPLRLFVGVHRLFGGKPLSRPHPHNPPD